MSERKAAELLAIAGDLLADAGYSYADRFTSDGFTADQTRRAGEIRAKLRGLTHVMTTAQRGVYNTLRWAHYYGWRAHHRRS